MFEARCGMPLGLSDVPLWHLCHLGRQWEISGWSRSVGLIERHAFDIRCIKILKQKNMNKCFDMARVLRLNCKMKNHTFLDLRPTKGPGKHFLADVGLSGLQHVTADMWCVQHHFFLAGQGPEGLSDPGDFWSAVGVLQHGNGTWEMDEKWMMFFLTLARCQLFSGGIMPCHPLTSELPGWASKLVDCSL